MISETIKTVRKNAVDKIEEIQRETVLHVAALETAAEVLPAIEATLKKLHLNIDTATTVWNNGRMRLEIRAESNGKFRFIKFQGYDSRGAGRNQKSLDSKASKLEEKIQAACGCRVDINPYSLEMRDSKPTNRVLISVSIG